MLELAIHRRDGRPADSFETCDWTEEWTTGDRTTRVSSWNRPLQAMTDASTAAGFRTAAIREPQPVPAARELFPEDHRVLATSPCFLFFVLRPG